MLICYGFVGVKPHVELPRIFYGFLYINVCTCVFCIFVTVHQYFHLSVVYI